MEAAQLRGAMRAGVWWLSSEVNPTAHPDAPEVCVAWTLQRTGASWTLRRRRVFSREGGVREEVRQATLAGDPPTELQYESGSERWLRAPRPGVSVVAVSLKKKAGGYTLVAAHPGRLVWVASSRLVAYHPDDSIVWFRSRAACLAARRSATANAGRAGDGLVRDVCDGRFC